MSHRSTIIEPKAFQESEEYAHNLRLDSSLDSTPAASPQPSHLQSEPSARPVSLLAYVDRVAPPEQARQTRQDSDSDQSHDASETKQIQPEEHMSYTEAFGGEEIHVGIAGIIGAGKSSLTKKLAKLLNFTSVMEPVATNPYLSDFYKDMKANAFKMQVWLLNRRYRHHQATIWGDKSSVWDRTIYEDVIFAKMLYESGNMSKLDFDTYRELFSNMANFLHRPDIIVYLDVTPEKAHQRVQKRGRDCEKTLPVEYLRDLQAGYEDWLIDVGGKKDADGMSHSQGRIPVVRIDWNEDDQDPKIVIEAIKAKLKKHLVSF